MRTVNQIMIEGEDVEIGSDSDVSDTSQISRIPTNSFNSTFMMEKLTAFFLIRLPKINVQFFGNPM